MITIDNKSTIKMAEIRVDRRITGLIKQFNEFIDGKTINEYFQLPKSAPAYTLTRNDKMTCRFTSSYTKKYNISKIKLPDDILRLINTYIDIHVLIIFDVVYGTDYPFYAPKWEIHKINAPPNISKQVEQITFNHNRQYQISWSPSISIEKDILYIIERLMKIEYI
jgi:hypothetical protein